MTAHISGTSLDSQERYANGVKEILDNYFNKKEQNPANLIVTWVIHYFQINFADIALVTVSTLQRLTVSVRSIRNDYLYDYEYKIIRLILFQFWKLAQCLA